MAPTTDIECNSAFECEGDSINNNVDTFSARGYESAASAVVDATRTISCSGSHSCYQAPKLQSDDDIDCLGELACFGSANIWASNNIKCVGSNSCGNANISTDGRIDCEGDNSCANANIS